MTGIVTNRIQLEDIYDWPDSCFGFYIKQIVMLPHRSAPLLYSLLLSAPDLVNLTPVPEVAQELHRHILSTARMLPGMRAFMCTEWITDGFRPPFADVDQDRLAAHLDHIVHMFPTALFGSCRRMVIDYFKLEMRVLLCGGVPEILSVPPEKWSIGWGSLTHPDTIHRLRAAGLQVGADINVIDRALRQTIHRIVAFMVDMMLYLLLECFTFRRLDDMDITPPPVKKAAPLPQLPIHQRLAQIGEKWNDTLQLVRSLPEPSPVAGVLPRSLFPLKAEVERHHTSGGVGNRRLESADYRATAGCEPVMHQEGEGLPKARIPASEDESRTSTRNGLTGPPSRLRKPLLSTPPGPQMIDACGTSVPVNNAGLLAALANDSDYSEESQEEDNVESVSVVAPPRFPPAYTPSTASAFETTLTQSDFEDGTVTEHGSLNGSIMPESTLKARSAATATAAADKNPQKKMAATMSQPSVSSKLVNVKKGPAGRRAGLKLKEIRLRPPPSLPSSSAVNTDAPSSTETGQLPTKEAPALAPVSALQANPSVLSSVLPMVDPWAKSVHRMSQDENLPCCYKLWFNDLLSLNKKLRSDAGLTVASHITVDDCHLATKSSSPDEWTKSVRHMMLDAELTCYYKIWFKQLIGEIRQLRSMAQTF